ncbi:hypothetical protein TRFO_23488 [Tritrichomonas foetus]|uniref:Uncharacterized protein n=1 Tax=Tritrichomonas foetus TaxID=1144522 RepID=A0A1J4KAY5_9EUKA|nr:hypothetical protein TRFO_23488 [Tritrichomonas foetus]|eukprot:OHT08122.1 hypothetical protein TRFO_23488 [Tritrichomonas foetus]
MIENQECSLFESDQKYRSETLNIDCYSDQNDHIRILWEKLFSFSDPIESLIFLQRYVNLNIIDRINSHQAHFLISIFTENVPASLKSQTSLFLASLFEKNPQAIHVFIESGFISIILPLFPKYHIASFLHYCAYESYNCSKYLIENNFVEILGNLLQNLNRNNNVKTNDLPDDVVLEENEDEQFDDNFIDFIQCAGSVCDLEEYSNITKKLEPILCSIAINEENDWKIRSESIHSLAILIRRSRQSCQNFIESSSLLNIIAPLCEINNYYLEAMCNLIGAILNHTDIMNDELFERLTNFLFTFLKITKSENCLILISNAISDASSNQRFSMKCISIGIISILFQIYDTDGSWDLKINIFESILKVFSYTCLVVIDFFNQHNFFNFLLNNITEMCCCNGYAIALALDSIINMISVTENTNLVEFLLHPEIEEAVEMLVSSDDLEIRYKSERISEFIQNIDNFE